MKKRYRDGKKLRKNEEEDLRFYWMTLRKRGNTGSRKRKH
jgi:hypothetical protein